MEKKINRKNIYILKYELEKKRILSNEKKKWKSQVAKFLKLEIQEKYQYLYRVNYKGSARLKSRDIICNSEGVLFAVVQEQNRRARIVTIDTYAQKPIMHGKFIIVEKAGDKKDNNPNTIK